MMPLMGLLISWATPAASSPMDARWAARIVSACRASFSVMSVATSKTLSIVPSSRTMGTVRISHCPPSGVDIRALAGFPVEKLVAAGHPLQGLDPSCQSMRQYSPAGSAATALESTPAPRFAQSTFRSRETRVMRSGMVSRSVLNCTESPLNSSSLCLRMSSVRLRSEDILRQSEEEFRGLSVQFRTLLDTMPDRITLVSRDLKVLWANRGAGVLSSAVAADPAGEYCRMLWHDGSRPCNGCPAATSFSTGKPANARMSTPDGGQWEMRTVPIVREDGTIESVLEVATDITEKLALQAETMRAAHLASIGELAAGVAHEINSPINGIINYAQILCNKSPAGSSPHDLASRILKEGNRIGDIVRGLLTFARERKEERRPVGVTDILSESLALTRAQMKAEGIVLLIHVPPHLSEIVANPQQIQQVFMNIINNARYALNQKYQGAHKNKILQIRGESMREGGVPYVRVTFRDRGVGIPAHLVNKVMEPFFSTKPSGNGTGLGLSVSHGIISDHHGRVTIESVEGEFTNVLVDLPARESAHGDDPRGR